MPWWRRITDPERSSECLWDQALWQEMVDLGWTMLAVPESAGGMGMPAVAVAGLAEELGRAAVPCPLLGTINATYVLAACGERGRGALAEIAEGRRPPWRLPTAQGSWSAGGYRCAAAPMAAQRHRLVCAGCPQGGSPAGQRAERSRGGPVLGGK